LSTIRTISEIFDFKNAVTMKTGLEVRQGHHSRAHMTSLAPSRVVFEIINVGKCRDLEIRDRVHSRSLKVVPFDRVGMVDWFPISVLQ